MTYMCGVTVAPYSTRGWALDLVAPGGNSDPAADLDGDGLPDGILAQTFPAGDPASLDYRKPAEGDADIKLQATLDDTSRAKLGLDLGPAVSGALPVKLTGKYWTLSG